MISVICVYNNKAVLKDMLDASVEKQSLKDFEKVFIDNTNNQFTGAAAALNFAASVAKGDILVFAHQDVEFCDDNSFEKIQKFCNESDFGIVGVAGVILHDKNVYSSVVTDKDRQRVGVLSDTVKKVDCIDECLMIIKKQNFEGFSDFGKTWHFYAVEYSLRMAEQAKDILLLPIEIYHLSPGWSLNKTYWTTLKQVAKRFKSHKIIPTTLGQYHNNCLLPIEIFLRKILRKIRNQ